MRRTSLVRIGALAAGLLAVAAAPALASIIELGKTKSALISPSCPPGVTPANCKIILTQVTVVETVRDGVSYPTTVKKAGYIVAFSLGLSSLSTNRATQKSDIHNLDSAFAGTTRAGIVVLQPVGSHKQFKWKLVAESPIFHLQPYLGQVAQFPLTTAIPVKPGEAIGLTVPTWAPVLSIDLSSSSYAYRQSRSSSCGTAPPTLSTQSIGEILAYKCDYPGTRVEYSATEVTSPVQDKPIPGT